MILRFVALRLLVPSRQRKAGGDGNQRRYLQEHRSWRLSRWRRNGSVVANALRPDITNASLSPAESLIARRPESLSGIERHMGHLHRLNEPFSLLF